jgi:hypothetical protein
LLIVKSGLFHSRYSPKLADFDPSLWYGREGAGQFYSPVGLRSWRDIAAEWESSVKKETGSTAAIMTFK